MAMKTNTLTKRFPVSSEPEDSIRSVVKFSERRFDIKTLAADQQRVYKTLAGKYGEEYALLFIFTMRTAVELHRAWHMTLLTSKILQQLKDKFRLRMTWTLGVFRLSFRVEDGGKELYRKVPYDYDSENQDIYMRIAVALMDGHINVHEALIYQSETTLGQHTAKSGLFLRDFPGRLVLYPFVASTCAVIFFSGDWVDFGIAALTGLASGIVEYTLGILGAGVLTDVLVGTSTGLIAGLFYRYLDEPVCLSAILLGTLYWFFYGTAFVIGILEIIAGELEVGVTRFIAVSVKTFVLCLGASFGLLVVGNASEAWIEQGEICTRDAPALDEKWWRIPLYLACSVAVLGQYRFPVVRYWRALVVMLVGYEVQYECFEWFASIHDRDNLDTATSNVFGAAASVVSACGVSYLVNQLRYYSDARIIRKDYKPTRLGTLIRKILACGVRIGHCVGLGRASDKMRLDMEKKLRQAKREIDDPNHERQHIELEPAEENLIYETIVGSQDMNIWSVLMPALYQLVPGSLIAKLWFNYIFPPPLISETVRLDAASELVALANNITNTTITEDQLSYTTYRIDEGANNVFSGLMIVSTTLALGLVFGFSVVRVLELFFKPFSCFQDKMKNPEQLERAKSRRAGMYSLPPAQGDDPEANALEFRNAILNGAATEAEADVIFNAVDWDQSDTIDRGELADYMLNAGLSCEQVDKLFASMDADASGEVSRTEFRRAILDKANQGLMKVPEEDVEQPATVGGEGLAILSGQYGPTEGGVQAGLPNTDKLETGDA